MDKQTKSMKLKYILCRTASICLTILPLVIYVILGLVNGEIRISQKVFLSFTCIMAIILTAINILFKHSLRSPLFLILLGLYYTLNNILTLMIIISIGIISDEFIFAPLSKKYKERYIINKELDKRL